jgi:hypothetical protein
MTVIDKPHTADEKVRAELVRFHGVVASRRLPSEFLELFTKLQKSDMFSTPAKPLCFAYLMEQSATKVPDHFLTKLLDAMENSGAVATIYAGLDKATAEQSFQATVLRMFKLAPLQASPQLDVFYRLERMGVSPDRNVTLDMALKAGAEMAFMDTVCDLTFEDYYPYMPARKGVLAHA